MNTTRKKRLGRGLDALLSKPTPTAEAVAVDEPVAGDADELRRVPVELLQRGRYQPRTDIREDSLEELADSIRSQGVVQPIVIRPLKTAGRDEPRYEIIAGERRWRAAQLAGLAEIPAVVRDVEDEIAVAMALIENIQRENLNPLEEAQALERLVREFELTHQEAATAVGRSRAAVSNLLRLLELSDRVKRMLASRELEMGHARALLALASGQQQLDAALEVVRRGLSVRATEELVKRMRAAPAKKKNNDAERADNADIRRLETEISDKLGARVKIDHSARGFGKLVITYNTLDELDGILTHIR